MEYNWDILNDGTDGNLMLKNLGKYGILILNRPIRLNPESFCALWENASWRITVDGGTDRWLRFTKEHNLTLQFPQQVTGDFDSIKPETLEFFRTIPEVEVLETPDQDCTDFDKALNILFKSCSEKLDYYVVILEHSGRLDQIFSNLNTMDRFETPGFMMTSDTLTWLLLPGYHRIHIPSSLREKKKPECCGILPFYASTIKSTGLKWNLDNRKVEFGGLISSSNTYDGSPEVIITNDKTVIWSMCLGESFM